MKSTITQRYCFEGCPQSPTGSARFIREIVMAARSLEMPISLKLIPGFLPRDELKLPHFFMRLLKRPPSGQIRCIFSPAFCLPKLESGVVWAFASFSHLSLSEVEVERLKVADRLWVHSPLHFELAKKKGFSPEKMKIFPATVNLKRFHPRNLPSSKIPQSREFSFLFVGTPLKRKGLDILLRAYLEEFKADEPVRLIIKLPYIPKIKKNFQWEISDLSKRLGAINSLFPKVTVVGEMAQDDEMGSIFKCGDVLVAPNRTFHSGLIVREALASGIPVIGSETLKNLVGLSEETGFLVQKRKTTMAANSIFPGSPEMVVEEPEIAHLRQRMREAFQKPRLTKEKGKTAAKTAKKLWPSWKDLAAEILALGNSIFTTNVKIKGH